MKLSAFFCAVLLVAANAVAAPVVLLTSPVRVVAEPMIGNATGKLQLALSVQHGENEFVVNVLQRGSATEAVAAQKATSGWKDGYLFIRDNCMSDEDPAAWRCVIDHVFTFVDDAKATSGKRLIYVGDVFAGEECIESARVGCALYKGTFTDIYDRLETNVLLSRAESPALLIETTVQSGAFTVDLEETWKANQERYLAGMKCLQAKPDVQKESCIDGINPRRAYLFNTALATYTRQDAQLARMRTFARAALCKSEPKILADADCGGVLRSAELLVATIKSGDKPRPRGNVPSTFARQK